VEKLNKMHTQISLKKPSYPFAWHIRTRYSEGIRLHDQSNAGFYNAVMAFGVQKEHEINSPINLL
jgi:hypothetical protein